MANRSAASLFLILALLAPTAARAMGAGTRRPAPAPQVAVPAAADAARFANPEAKKLNEARVLLEKKIVAFLTGARGETFAGLKQGLEKIKDDFRAKSGIPKEEHDRLAGLLLRDERMLMSGLALARGGSRLSPDMTRILSAAAAKSRYPAEAVDKVLQQLLAAAAAARHPAEANRIFDNMRAGVGSASPATAQALDAVKAEFSSNRTPITYTLPHDPLYQFTNAARLETRTAVPAAPAAAAPVKKPEPPVTPEVSHCMQAMNGSMMNMGRLCKYTPTGAAVLAGLLDTVREQFTGKGLAANIAFLLMGLVMTAMTGGAWAIVKGLIAIGLSIWAAYKLVPAIAKAAYNAWNAASGSVDKYRAIRQLSSLVGGIVLMALMTWLGGKIGKTEFMTSKATAMKGAAAGFGAKIADSSLGRLAAKAKLPDGVSAMMAKVSEGTEAVASKVSATTKAAAEKVAATTKAGMEGVKKALSPAPLKAAVRVSEVAGHETPAAVSDAAKGYMLVAEDAAKVKGVKAPHGAVEPAAKPGAAPKGAVATLEKPVAAPSATSKLVKEAVTAYLEKSIKPGERLSVEKAKTLMTDAMAKAHDVVQAHATANPGAAAERVNLSLGIVAKDAAGKAVLVSADAGESGIYLERAGRMMKQSAPPPSPVMARVAALTKALKADGFDTAGKITLSELKDAPAVSGLAKTDPALSSLIADAEAQSARAARLAREGAPVRAAAEPKLDLMDYKTRVAAEPVPGEPLGSGRFTAPEVVETPLKPNDIALAATGERAAEAAAATRKLAAGEPVPETAVNLMERVAPEKPTAVAELHVPDPPLLKRVGARVGEVVLPASKAVAEGFTKVVERFGERDAFVGTTMFASRVPGLAHPAPTGDPNACPDGDCGPGRGPGADLTPPPAFTPQVADNGNNDNANNTDGNGQNTQTTQTRPTCPNGNCDGSTKTPTGPAKNGSHFVPSTRTLASADSKKDGAGGAPEAPSSLGGFGGGSGGGAGGAGGGTGGASVPSALNPDPADTAALAPAALAASPAAPEAAHPAGFAASPAPVVAAPHTATSPNALGGGHDKMRSLASRFDGTRARPDAVAATAPETMQGLGAGSSPALPKLTGGPRMPEPAKAPAAAAPKDLLAANDAPNAPAQAPAAAPAGEDYNYTYLAPAQHKYELPDDPPPAHGKDWRSLLNLGVQSSAALAAIFLMYHSDFGYLVGATRKRRSKGGRLS
jgi:hypothetical protein